MRNIQFSMPLNGGFYKTLNRVPRPELLEIRYLMLIFAHLDNFEYIATEEHIDDLVSKIAGALGNGDKRQSILGHFYFDNRNTAIHNKNIEITSPF